jgi:hypothetical protein
MKSLFARITKEKILTALFADMWTVGIRAFISNRTGWQSGGKGRGMSNTPRTDANERETDTGWLVVGSDFSRQLETELAEARAEIERLRKLMVEIIELRTADCYKNQLKHDPVFKIAKTAERGGGI